MAKTTNAKPKSVKMLNTADEVLRTVVDENEMVLVPASVLRILQSRELPDDKRHAGTMSIQDFRENELPSVPATQGTSVAPERQPSGSDDRYIAYKKYRRYMGNGILSDREAAVFLLLTCFGDKGMPIKRIARVMRIHPREVRTHRDNGRRKMREAPPAMLLERRVTEMRRLAGMLSLTPPNGV